MRIRHIVFLTATSFFWAGNFVAGSYLAHSISPLLITFYRYLISLFFFLPWMYKNTGWILPTRKTCIYLAIMGLTGVFLFNFLLYFSLHYTDVVIIGILSALMPFSTALFNQRETPISLYGWLGILISLGGVILVVSRGNLSSLASFTANIGELSMLLAIVIWGIFSWSGSKAMKEISHLTATTYSSLLGVSMMLPFLWTEREKVYPNFTPTTVFLFLYISIVATVIAVYWWNKGVKEVGGVKSGLFLNLNPLFTAIIGYLFLGHQITTLQIVGASIVIIGVIIAMVSFKQIRS